MSETRESALTHARADFAGARVAVVDIIHRAEAYLGFLRADGPAPVPVPDHPPETPPAP